MTIHREGYKTIAVAALIFGAINISLCFFFSASMMWLCSIVFILTLALLLFLISFFRIPNRDLTINDNAIIAPADGKVVVIEETEESEYFKDKRIQVSIFMSPINVHVNRYPIAGEVTYAKYHAGKFLVASLPKASTENERTSIVVKHATNGKSVLFRQVAGALARRIVMYSKQGDLATQCGEMGFIKFGSRVDLYLPLDAKLKVKMGDVCIGSQTVIAEF